VVSGVSGSGKTTFGKTYFGIPFCKIKREVDLVAIKPDSIKNITGDIQSISQIEMADQTHLIKSSPKQPGYLHIKAWRRNTRPI